MPTRTRTRTLKTVLPGSYQIVRISDGTVIGGSSGASGVSEQERTTDTTMAPPYNVDHPFVCSKEGTKDGALRLYGTMPYSLGGYEYRFNGYNPQNRSLYQYRPAITPVNWAYWRTKALANMNPNAPVVDIPLFIFEFKDFPAMLRNMGNVLGKRMNPRDIPEGWLSYSFGWKPLVNDLLSLFDFTKQMEDRLAYLRRLEHGGHIRRSLGGGVVQHYVTPNGYSTIAVTGKGNALTADVEVVEKQRVWYTANAKLLDPLPLLLSEQRALSQDIVLGLNVDPSTVWNMIPWSWLIDYFSNIGDVMLAYRGGLRFSCTRMCLMCTSDIRSKLTNIRYGGTTTSEGTTMHSLVKQRNVYVNPRPQLTWDPILSGTQILNLGALLTAGALKGLR